MANTRMSDLVILLSHQVSILLMSCWRTTVIPKLILVRYFHHYNS